MFLNINDNIYFLKVGKTRIKYFKDYIQINPEEVLEYALDANWKVLCSENTEYTVEYIEEFIKHSYSDKAQKIILNSRVIRKRKHIAEYKSALCTLLFFFLDEYDVVSSYIF